MDVRRKAFMNCPLLLVFKDQIIVIYSTKSITTIKLLHTKKNFWKCLVVLMEQFLPLHQPQPQTLYLKIDILGCLEFSGLQWIPPGDAKRPKKLTGKWAKIPNNKDNQLLWSIMWSLLLRSHDAIVVLMSLKSENISTLIASKWLKQRE